MELQVKNAKVWILENISDESNVERFVYDDEKSAILRIRDLMSTVDTEKLNLATVDMSGKTWNITGVPWSTVALGIVRIEKEKKE